MWHCLCDPIFSRFGRTPTCDRQTHDYNIYHAVNKGNIYSDSVANGHSLYTSRAVVHHVWLSKDDLTTLFCFFCLSAIYVSDFFTYVRLVPWPQKMDCSAVLLAFV